MATLPAPRLVFSEDEMALAHAVAGYPGLADFYGSNGLKPIFLGAEGAARRQALINSVATAASHGLPAARYDAARLLQLDGQGPETLQAELVYARAFVRWSQDLTGGILDPRKVDPGIKRAPKRKAMGELMREFQAAADPAAWLADLAPRDREYLALQDALKGMARLAAPVGTPQIPPGTWREGASGEGVLRLRQRLDAMGFLSRPEGSEGQFDATLGQAVAAFQEAAGLPADGVAGPVTVARLNRGLGPEAKGILVALERMRWMQGYDLDQRMVWVNLPTFTAVVKDRGEEVFSTRVVIGEDKDTHETPEFTEDMRFIVANPRWNVPRSITVKEYLPRLKANRHAVSHLDVVDSAGNVISRDRIDFGKYSASSFPYRMRQKPSDDNALGVVKFLFPNNWNIYLHDTPTKHLFNRDVRAFSHGCIRVGRPLDLAHVLLQSQPGNPQSTFSKALASGKESYLTLKNPLPVHLVYFTAFPDSNGKIRRYADIYGRDARVYAALMQASGESRLDSAQKGN